MNSNLPLRILIGAFLFLTLRPSAASDRPVTGTPVPAYAALDAVVNNHMNSNNIEAASLAVAFNGKLVHARGFGWSDEAKKKPTQPGSMFRLASNTKPITAAVIRHLFATKTIAPQTRVFDYLGIQPYNQKVGDPRLALITIGHLLDHKGGWDKDETFDPMYQFGRIQQEMGISEDLNRVHIIRYMLSQPLQFTPGERRAYSNFGYLVLGRVVEKATRMEYIDAVQRSICRPLRINDIQISPLDPEKRDRREIFYPRESGLDMSLRDSVGGLTASAPSLCGFLQKYWISGESRNRSQKRTYVHTGSHPNSTATLMEQRIDGIDYVVLLNSSQGDTGALKSHVNAAIEQIKRQ